MGNFLSALIFRRIVCIPRGISKEELDARVTAFPFTPGSLKHIPYKKLGYLVAPHTGGGWMISRDVTGGWRTPLVAMAENSSENIIVLRIRTRFHRAAILFQSIFLVFALVGSIYHLFLGHYNSFGLIIGFLLFIYLLDILTFLAATRKMERWIREDFLHSELV